MASPTQELSNEAMGHTAQQDRLISEKIYLSRKWWSNDIYTKNNSWYIFVHLPLKNCGPWNSTKGTIWIHKNVDWFYSTQFFSFYFMIIPLTNIHVQGQKYSWKGAQTQIPTREEKRMKRDFITVLNTESNWQYQQWVGLWK